MNAKIMFEREDFFQVFSDTVVEYFSKVHNLSVTISERKTANSVAFYLYYLPLFAASYPMNPGMKRFLYSEYNIRGSFLKYIVGKVGVFLISHAHGIGSYATMYISPNNELINDVFISPCNRTIRFYYFKKGYVDCFAKSGYSTEFLTNQLSIRDKLKYSFIPKVDKSGANWYREKIMYGNSLARVRDRAVHDAMINRAFSCVSQLASDTLQYIDFSVYFSDISKRILDELVKYTNEEQIDFSNLIEKYTNGKQIDFYNKNFLVPLCISHGDFQEGNIWVGDDGHLSIYDWETAQLRSVWYDMATMLWNLHGAEFPENVLHLLKNDTRYLRNDPQKYYSEAQQMQIATIIILEDLLFNLVEARQLQPHHQSKRLLDIKTRFERILNCGR